MKSKSVRSNNLCQSVVQTIYDIMKAHGKELKVESKKAHTSQFSIQVLLP